MTGLIDSVRGRVVRLMVGGGVCRGRETEGGGVCLFIRLFAGLCQCLLFLYTISRR